MHFDCHKCDTTEFRMYTNSLLPSRSHVTTTKLLNNTCTFVVTSVIPMIGENRHLVTAEPVEFET